MSLLLSFSAFSRHIVKTGSKDHRTHDTARTVKGQIKAKDIFIDINYLRFVDFNSSNEIFMRAPEPIEIAPEPIDFTNYLVLRYSNLY